MNILVIGTGAIGSFYGSLLTRSGHTVSVVARSDYETVKQHGIAINSAPLGDYHFQPARVVRSGAELAEKPDYVLLCVKVVKGADRIGLLKDVLGEDTRIVLISNGIDIENEIAEAFPGHELISGLAFICVTRTEPGKVWHQAYGRLVLGNYPQGVSDSTRALCDAYKRAGISCATSENITTARWQKCVWNAAFNPISVLAGGLGTAEILKEQEPLLRGIMREITEIAHAAGHTLAADVIDISIGSTLTMPTYKTSMLIDFEAGRPMETEAILGNAVKWGQRLGVAVPHLETLYGLMKLRERSMNRLLS
ncbi:2-dehydropantoate 2-reductase [Candidatus Methylospira mobilis]|uniref:ketopantoate reductase family protein n=1 Tax=Candidatus Methylospira mobilis TaxID=1808979 RepID=UPI0028F0E015|nr:2-dehydropantoate 2-reductase [Candidatus Methylospira mobilis]WNV06766.1 2-dehydropantoate 2-reductase [Candidatus Methylospira mobilis]